MSRSPVHLFVVPWPTTDVGGVNQVVLNLYRHFEADGLYTPRILVASWDHPVPSSVEESGRSVTYMRVRVPVISGASLGATARSLTVLVVDALRVARYLRANDVASVNVHYPSLAAFNFILARLVRTRLRVVLSFHGLDVAQALRTKGLERWLWRLMLRKADAVVGCSNALRESLVALEPSLRSRAKTIRNGIDIAQLMRARNRSSELDARLREQPFILAVASYEHKKGLDVLIRAFASVRETLGGDLMLALVGPDLGAGDELRSLAARLGVSSHVALCGVVPHADLHAYYRAARVFCLPSRAEPFGIVLLEAGAFRCPVVATSTDGIPEILSDGVHACLVPPDDPEALAIRLIALLRDKKECRRLSNALFDHVRAHFPWRTAYEAYVRLCGHPSPGERGAVPGDTAAASRWPDGTPAAAGRVALRRSARRA